MPTGLGPLPIRNGTKRSRSTPTTARAPPPRRPAAAEQRRGSNHRCLHPPLPHVTQPHSLRPPLATQQAALVWSSTGILPSLFPGLLSVCFPSGLVPRAVRDPSVCRPFLKTALPIISGCKLWSTGSVVKTEHKRILVALGSDMPNLMVARRDAKDYRLPRQERVGPRGNSVRTVIRSVVYPIHSQSSGSGGV